ncbi:MAG: metal ABC transporter permease [Myxococcales bacterium]|nr:metal ABC transporter permease [Myxococcales bacterium]
MEWLASPTFRTVLLGATLLGAVSGVIGCFALLRRQSLLGDALAHAALPGVCVAFIVTGAKHPLSLLVGAGAAGLCGALFVMLVVRGSRIKEDSALGIVLSVFFGLGVVLLTRIQKMPAGNQSGLDQFLFGQAATLLEGDVIVFSVVGVAVLVVIALLYKELKLLCFDRAFGAILGFPMRGLEVLLTVLLVVVVVIGLSTVGVVLMVASLITPAAAARQWTDRLSRMLLLSALFGAISAAVGVVASASVSKLPTGPSIVIVSSALLLVSVLAAPRRGVLWAALRARRTAHRVRAENLLKDVYRWCERRGDFETFVPLTIVMGMRGEPGRRLYRTRDRLVRRGLLLVDGDQLKLTRQGRREAARMVRRHRLWEVYLVRRLELPADHVHRDAEAMEHALTDELVEELGALLGHPEVDPHGQPIPPREPLTEPTK